jgi:hypothetical protein
MSKNGHLHFLLVYIHLRTGGIETLIVRMANWLIAGGHRVTLLLKEPGELLELLDERVEVEVLGPKRFLFFLPFLGKRHLRKYDEKEIDVIYSYGPEACYFASYVYKYGFKGRKPAFMNGIYHPQEFALGGEISILDRMYINLYDKLVNNGSKIFMSEEVRRGNAEILGAPITGSSIWPLPIDSSRFCNIVRKAVPYKIVSIGRFTKFKSYNIYMFDVIEELLQMGYDVTWDIYGYGPMEDEMRGLINARGQSKRIFMKGVLPYKNYAEAMAVAHVFVGMGTALIEAGFCRVPCVASIANDTKGLTYGALYNLPYYSCGEPLSDDYKTFTVTNAIRRIFDMNQEEYEKETELTFQYVQPYSIDGLMQKFVERAKAAPLAQDIDSYPGWKFSYYCAKMLFQMARQRCRIRTRLRSIINQATRGASENRCVV